MSQISENIHDNVNLGDKKSESSVKRRKYINLSDKRSRTG